MQLQGAREQATTTTPPEGEAVVAEPPHEAVGLVAGVALLVSGLAGMTLTRGPGRRLLERASDATPPPWTAADVVTLILLHLACQVVAAGVLLPNPLPEGVVVWQQLAAGIAASLTTLLIAVPLMVVRCRSWRALQLTSRRPLGDIAAGLLMLLAITPPLLLVAGMLNRIVPYHHPILDFLASEQGPWALTLTATSAVIVAPLAEEFFFRGVLQGWLERVKPALAIPVSAAAFGLAHVDHGLGWIPLVGFGIASSLLARQTGSLVASITLHAGFNAVGLLAAMSQLPATR